MHLLKTHGDAASGATLGGVSGIAIATTTAHPELWVEIARWAGAALLSLLPIVVTRVLAYREARASRLAQLERARAAQLRADNNPDNDARADELDALADEHEAEAAGVGAARATSSTSVPAIKRLPPGGDG